MVHTLLNSIVSIRVDGQSNIPSEGGALIVCNHTDYIDALIQGLYSKRELVFLAKAELFDDDLFTRLQLYRDEARSIGVPRELIEILDELLNLYSQFLDDINILPIIRNYRSGKAKSNQEYYDRILYSAIETIDAGKILAMYPEGRRSTDGEIHNFKTFAARIALQTQAPVIPATILGAHGISDPVNWISGKNTHRTITYKIGPAIDRNQCPTSSNKTDIKKMTDILFKSVETLFQTKKSRSRT